MDALTAIAQEAEGEVKPGLVLGGGAVRGAKGGSPGHGNIEGMWVGSDEHTAKTDDKEATIPILLPPASSTLRRKPDQQISRMSSQASTTIAATSEVGSEAAFLLGKLQHTATPSEVVKRSSQQSSSAHSNLKLNREPSSTSFKKVSISTESIKSYSNSPNSNQYGAYLEAEMARFNSPVSGQSPGDFPSQVKQTPTSIGRGDNYLNASNLRAKTSPTISLAGSISDRGEEHSEVKTATFHSDSDSDVPLSKDAAEDDKKPEDVPEGETGKEKQKTKKTGKSDYSTPFHNLLRIDEPTAPEREGSTEEFRTGLIIPDSPRQRKVVARPFQGQTFHETVKKYPARKMRHPSANASMFVPLPQEASYEPVISPKQHSRLEARDLTTLYNIERPSTDLLPEEESDTSEPFDLAVQVGTDRVDSLGRAIHLLESEMRRLKSTFGAVNEVLLDTVEAQLDLHKENINMNKYQWKNCLQWMGNLREVLTGERHSSSHLSRLRSLERCIESQPPRLERAQEISKDLSVVAARYEEWKIYVMKALQTHKVIQAEVSDWRNVSYGRLGNVRWDIQRLQSRLDIAKEQLEQMLSANCMEHTKIDPNIIMNIEGLKPSWLQGRQDDPSEDVRSRFPFLPEGGISEAVKEFLHDTTTNTPTNDQSGEEVLFSTYNSITGLSSTLPTSPMSGKQTPTPQQSPSSVSVFSSPTTTNGVTPARKGFSSIAPPSYDHIFGTNNHPKTKQSDESLTSFLDVEQLSTRRLATNSCLLLINGSTDGSVLVMRNIRAGVVGGHPSLDLMSISGLLTDSLLLDRIVQAEVLTDVAGGLLLKISKTDRNFESPRRTHSKVGDLTMFHDPHGGRKSTQRDSKYDTNYSLKNVTLRETERSLSKNRTSSPRPPSVTYKMQLNIKDRDTWLQWIRSSKFNPYVRK